MDRRSFIVRASAALAGLYLPARWLKGSADNSTASTNVHNVYPGTGIYQELFDYQRKMQAIINMQMDAMALDLHARRRRSRRLY